MSCASIEEILEPIRSDFADDPDFAELLDFFFHSVNEKIPLLQSAWEARDIGSLQTYAHQLKGSGGGYGFDGLTPVAFAVEEACKAGDLDLVESSLPDLINYLSRVRP